MEPRIINSSLQHSFFDHSKICLAEHFSATRNHMVVHILHSLDMHGIGNSIVKSR